MKKTDQSQWPKANIATIMTEKQKDKKTNPTSLPISLKLQGSRKLRRVDLKT